MEIDGYMLLQAIQQHELNRDAALETFNQSFYAFEDEEKEGPVDLAMQYLESETAIALLQTAQAQYNTRIQVTVKIDGKKKDFLLATAIKLVGGAGRLSRLWKSSLQHEDGGWRRSLVPINAPKARRKEDEYEVPVIDRAEILKRSKEAARLASALRAAIAKGNTMKVKIDLDPKLLDV